MFSGMYHSGNVMKCLLVTGQVATHVHDRLDRVEADLDFQSPPCPQLSLHSPSGKTCKYLNLSLNFWIVSSSVYFY